LCTSCVSEQEWFPRRTLKRLPVTSSGSREFSGKDK
jgi:hypothetical protein